MLRVCCCRDFWWVCLIRVLSCVWLFFDVLCRVVLRVNGGVLGCVLVCCVVGICVCVAGCCVYLSCG